MRYEQNMEYRLRRVGPKSFLIRANEAIELAGIGQDIWKRMATPRSASEIAQDLAEVYDAQVAQIEVDVVEFIDVLSHQGAARAVS